MSPTANVSELVAAMRGLSVTSNWDVVVSYTTERLNSVLDDLWIRGGLGNAFPIKPKKSDGQVENDYDMRLHKPRLSFATNSAASAILRMDISGSCWVGGRKQGGKVVDIHAGTFQIEFEVPLISVPGGVSMQGNQIPSDKISHPNSLVDFGPAPDQNIIFHFKAIPQEKWELKTMDQEAADSLDATIDMSEVASELHTWFYDNVKDVDYTIAQVNNQTIPDAANFKILRPESFVFACCGDGAEAVLSIYIKIQDSGFNSGDLNPTWPIAPGNQVYRPVPAGFEASVIIRHEIMRQSLLDSINSSVKLPSGQPAATDTRDNNEDGFKFSVKVNRDYVQDTWKDSTLADWLPLPIMREHGGKLFGDLENSPLTLRIQNNDVAWSLGHWQKNILWQRDNHWSDPPSGVIGSVDAYCWVDHRDKLVTSQSNLKAPVYTFKAVDHFKFSFTPQPDPDPRSKWSFWKQFFNPPGPYRWTEDLPAKFGGYQVHFDDVAFTFQGLNFLLTKNVFANPVKQDVIQVDTDQGLLTPHDVMLVGKVVQPTEKDR